MNMRMAPAQESEHLPDGCSMNIRMALIHPDHLPGKKPGFRRYHLPLITVCGLFFLLFVEALNRLPVKPHCRRFQRFKASLTVEGVSAFGNRETYSKSTQQKVKGYHRTFFSGSG
jgi:hypothetical protein